MTMRKPKRWGSVKPSVGFGVDWSDPINKGLVGCWLANEGAGNKLFDIARKNHGAFNNSPTWGPGKFGPTLNFASVSSQFVDVGTDASLNISGNMTMAAWVNATTFPANGVWANILAKKYDGATIAYFFDLLGQPASTLLRAGAFGGSGNSTSWTIAGWNTGEWHHVCALNDGTNWIIYFDGKNVNSLADSAGAQANAGRLTLGCLDLTGTPGRFLNGKLDHTRVYNRALKPSEVLRLYSEPFSGILTPRRRLWNGAPAAGGGNSGVGTSVGAAVVSGIGAALAAGVATSAGLGVAAAIGAAVAVAVGTIAGIAALSGIGAELAAATATSAGAATAPGKSAGPGIGTAAGVGVANGITLSLVVSGVGTATGTSIVLGLSPPVWTQIPPAVAAWVQQNAATASWSLVASLSATWTKQFP